MAPGRKPRDDGDGDGDGDSEMVAESVYLVTARDDDQAAYTVLKVDGAAAAQTVAELPGGEPGMSFVAAHSKHGSWIVAVGGGLRAGTIIFDPSTSATYRGPRLVEPMHKPVLISHGGQVYALSRRPRVVPGMDFEPWFESLSFKEGVPSLDGEALVGWDRLPSPPFFPLSLDPYEFRNPPEIVVSSYAAVGPYILVSPQPELLVGTYAFHVVNKTWEKVHDKNLPFVGHAVPVGGSLFAACPISNKAVTDSASLFYMSIDSSPSTPLAAVSRPSLLLHEFPVITSVPKVGPLFCPLGKGRFCSVRSVSFSGSHGKANLLKEVQVILAAFKTDMQTEIIEAILTACQSQGAEVNNLQLALRVKEQSRTYDLLDSSMLVVAALSMNTENIDVSIQGETTETRGNQSTIILEAPVIRYWGREGRIC